MLEGTLEIGVRMLPLTRSAPVCVVLIPRFDNVVANILLQSHRTMSRVRSVSSPPLIMLFLAISMVCAAATVPFWEGIFILGTGFWFFNSNEVGILVYVLFVFARVETFCWNYKIVAALRRPIEMLLISCLMRDDRFLDPYHQLNSAYEQ